MNLPNKLSIARICMVPVFLFFIVPVSDWNFLSGFNDFINTWGIFIAGVIFILASVTDLIDGYIARSRNLVTDFGKFIDPIADKLLVTAAIIVLVQMGALNTWFAFIIIGRELLVSGFRMVVSGSGVVIAANIWGKLKTLLQTIAISVMIFEIRFKDLISWYPKEFAPGDIIMIFAVIMTVVSGYTYFKDNFHLLKDKM